LLGTHDFSAFRASQCQAKSPIKHLRQLDIRREGDMLVFDVSADAFLHHMVRNLIGCLVYVGKGKYPPQWLADVLSSRDRKLAAPTFAPDGLYLRRIQYDEKWGLPQQEDTGLRMQDY
jgi:tRNA pseudouridine38-40 synthase